jgi:hypothetical protein
VLARYARNRRLGDALHQCDLPRGFRTDHPLGWPSGKVTYFAPSEEELLAGIQG